MPQTATQEAFEFKAEVQQLLNILVHSLSTDKEIFLRELISNASDALNRVQFEMLTNHDVLDPEVELKIEIEVDEDAKTVTIRDTGVGMTRDELILNLGTIAKSGAKEFLSRLQENRDQANRIIGQFGVGFYSVFMAAKKPVPTRKRPRPSNGFPTVPILTPSNRLIRRHAAPPLW
jgi:molecular chaperone HtpG